jgi:pSer/pThr/pTyr-binding forkhead associated (FHA) protein
MIRGQLVDRDTRQVYPLGFEPMSIGRAPENRIILADPQVSRHHAEVAMQGGRWVIRDLGSANGTYVNGQQITALQVLENEDLIRIGRTTFRAEIVVPLTEQDTLLGQRVPPPPVPAGAGAIPARSGIPTLALILGLIALVALIFIGALVIWPLIQGDQGVAQPTVELPGPTAVVQATEAGSAALPTEAPTQPQPTETSIPTVPPPTLEPTQPLPTPTPMPVTDTPLPPEPVIGYFRTSQSTIEPGQCTRLEWGGVQQAAKVTLTSVGQVGDSGKIDVCLDATKAYTLKATGPGGTAEKSVRITVLAPVGPIVDYFRVVPSIVSPGGCAQLEWGKVENANTASIEPGIGGVGTPGSTQVCPGGTTTYVLTAINPEATTTAQATLYVSTGADPKPVIASFSANPASIRAGECTTLRWGKVDYATSVTIAPNIGGVATPGSQEICLGQTATYVLVADGPGGTTKNSVTVSVSPGQLANLPDIVIESIQFEPNPCYRGEKCKVRVKVRNDGPVNSEHFIVRWSPEGEDQVPVEWDVDYLIAKQETELTYPWIPDRIAENWRTVAIADLKEEVSEIEEGAANALEQFITVLEP